MKKYIALLLIFTLTGCQSIQTFLGYPLNVTGEEMFIKPDKFEGCRNYNGRKRLECNNGLILQLEKIKNSSFRRKIIKIERIDELHIKQLIKACSVETRPDGTFTGEELHCWNYWTKPIYKPTFLRKLGRQLVIFGMGILTGAAAIASL